MSDDPEIWTEMADKVFDLGKGIFNHPSLSDPKLVPSDTKVIALLLLARTLSNFEAVRYLLRGGHVLEGRVITRCCFENSFWVSALAKRGEEFFAEMRQDYEAHVLKHAKHVGDWANEQDKSVGSFRALIEEAAKIKSTGGKRSVIRHLMAAVQGDVPAGYIAYAALSSDAAHPSMESLANHIRYGNTWSDFTFRAEADGDADGTLGLAIKALFVTCASANEIIEGTKADVAFPELSKEIEDLDEIQEGMYRALDEIDNPKPRPQSKYAKKVAKRRAAPKRPKSSR